MHRERIFAIAMIALIGIGVGVVQRPESVTRSNQTAVETEVVSKPALVGREVCRECHAENFALHAQHGHASTFHFVSDTDLAATFGGRTFDSGEPYGTYHYQASDDGTLSVTLPSQFGDERFPLKIALGSGTHAQTMLTLAPGMDGQTEGIEHRVTCYAGGRLGLTPGQAQSKPRTALEYFGDAARGDPLRRCIYCHTTRAEIAGEQLVNLVANVNCEKCHGPGSEHVRAARGNPNPPPYSVGQETWDTESEIQLCGDCHRLPRSVSEKEIREYPDVLARFQPIGLLRSRCYLDSEGELKCTTCHSPHTTISQMSEADHVSKCIHCHQTNHASHVECPVSPESGCIKCHMPAVELDEGLKFHDHWIRVHDG